MIEQVPRSRAYSEQHLEDTEELMRMINGFATIAPEFGDENVMLPLAAILDWTMGTPAGFAPIASR
jgi:phosphatidylserine decarboxylase